MRTFIYAVCGLLGLATSQEATGQEPDVCQQLEVRAATAESHGSVPAEIFAAARELECNFARDTANGIDVTGNTAADPPGTTPEAAPTQEQPVTESPEPEPASGENGSTLAELERENEDLVVVLRDLQDELASVRASENALQSQLDSREQEMETLTADLAAAREELAAAREEIERLAGLAGPVAPDGTTESSEPTEDLEEALEDNAAQAETIAQQQQALSRRAEQIAQLEAELADTRAELDARDDSLSRRNERLQASLAEERAERARAARYQGALSNLLASFIEVQFLSRGIDLCGEPQINVVQQAESLHVTVSAEVLGDPAIASADEVSLPIEASLNLDLYNPDAGLCAETIGDYRLANSGSGVLGVASRSDAIQNLDSLPPLAACEDIGTFLETEPEMAPYRDATEQYQRGAWMRDAMSGRLAACVWSGASYRGVLQSSRYQDLVIVLGRNN